MSSNEVHWVVTRRENTEVLDLSLGQPVYVRHCSSCHSVDRSGSRSSGFPSLVALDQKMPKTELREVISQRKGDDAQFSTTYRQ